jgi:Phage integrase family
MRRRSARAGPRSTCRRRCRSRQLRRPAPAAAGNAAQLHGAAPCDRGGRLSLRPVLPLPRRQRLADPGGDRVALEGRRPRPRHRARASPLLPRPRRPAQVEVRPAPAQADTGARAGTRTLRGTAGDAELVWTAEKGGRIDQSNLMSDMLKPAAAKAGLGDWVGFHTFRHTCATSLFRSGWNAVQVQRWLGPTSRASPSTDTCTCSTRTFPSRSPWRPWATRWQPAPPKAARRRAGREGGIRAYDPNDPHG